jgi:hypothetical protein
LLSVILAGLLWGFLGRVTSTVTAPALVVVAKKPAAGRTAARARGSSRLTLLLPADAVQNVHPGMRATFSRQGSGRIFGGSVRQVLVGSAKLSWPKGAPRNTPKGSPATVALITISASLPRSSGASSSLPAAGVTGSAVIVTRERRPISLLVP